MSITCFIRYQIDPFQHAAFDRAQAERFILREERSGLQDVTATRHPARQVAP